MLDNRHLFDISMRMQLATEGFKRSQVQIYNRTMMELQNELRRVLNGSSFSSFDQLSKTQMLQLAVKLRRFQLQVYNRYTNEVLDMLRSFMSVSVKLNRKAYYRSFSGYDVPGDVRPLYGPASIAGGQEGDDRLWSILGAAPMGANGLTPDETLAGFSSSSRARIDNAVWSGFANNDSTADVLANTVGTAANGYRDGIVSKLSGVSATVTDTLIQNVAIITSAAVASAFVREYRWISILDSKTSASCLDRSNKIFTFGRGPVPPGHMRCRAHISPIMPGGGDMSADRFYTWLREQPEDFISSIFSESTAKGIIDGSLTAEQINGLSYVKPLSLKDLGSLFDSIYS